MRIGVYVEFQGCDERSRQWRYCSEKCMLDMPQTFLHLLVWILPSMYLLLQFGKRNYKSKGSGSITGEEFGQQLMQAVELTAAAHRGYQQLFDVATFHRDSDHLYAQMSSLGPQVRGWQIL